MGISRDEWLAALAEAGLEQVDDQDALTVSEFAEMMGMTRYGATQRLNALVSAGKAIKTSKRLQRTTSGGAGTATAYRLIVPEPKTRKGKAA